MVIGVKNPNESIGGQLEIEAEGVDFNIKPNIKDWLEDKLPNLTDPPITKIDVKLISTVEDNSQHGVLVIYISPSDLAPHQAQDRKFYARLGSKLNPLSTRLILDITQRKKHPVLDLRLHLNWSRPDNSRITWILKNRSDVLAKNVAISLDCPPIIRGAGIHFDEPGTFIDKTESGEDYIHVGCSNLNSTPLFPKSSLRGSLKLNYGCTYDPPIENPIELLTAKIYADSMPYLEKTFTIDDITG